MKLQGDEMIVDKTSKEHWEEVLPHREAVLLEDLELFNDFWVVTERSNGLTKIRIQKWDGSEDYYLPLEGETYTVYTTTNIAFDTTKLLCHVDPMTTPSSVMEFDMVSKTMLF